MSAGNGNPCERRLSFGSSREKVVVSKRVQSAEGEEAFVRLWSMRGRALTAAAELRVGAPFRATLRPWSEAPAAAASASRSELDDRPQGAPVAWGTP